MSRSGLFIVTESMTEWFIRKCAVPLTESTVKTSELFIFIGSVFVLYPCVKNGEPEESFR